MVKIVKSVGITLAIVSTFSLFPQNTRAETAPGSGLTISAVTLKRNCGGMFYSSQSLERCIEGPTAASVIVAKRQHPYTIQRVTIPASGSTTVHLTPGDYLVYPNATAAVYPLSRSKSIRIEGNGHIPLNLYYRTIILGGYWR